MAHYTQTHEDLDTQTLSLFIQHLPSHENENGFSTLSDDPVLAEHPSGYIIPSTAFSSSAFGSDGWPFDM